MTGIVRMGSQLSSLEQGGRSDVARQEADSRARMLDKFKQIQALGDLGIIMERVRTGPASESDRQFYGQLIEQRRLQQALEMHKIRQEARLSALTEAVQKISSIRLVSPQFPLEMQRGALRFNRQLDVLSKRLIKNLQEGKQDQADKTFGLLVQKSRELRANGFERQARELVDCLQTVTKIYRSFQ